MTAMTFLAHIRLVSFAALLLALMVSAPGIAQKIGPDGAPNPTASVTSERELFRQFPRAEGRIDIPDTKASVLIQPAGRTWDYFHEVLLHWGGAIVILGMVAVLGAAYLIMGRLRITAGRSGRKIVRFKAFERFSHWLTAVSFVILGLTGLNITFGKILLLPVIGPDGHIRQNRGVTAAPGVYVVGQRFQYRRDSAFIGGARHDAAAVVQHLLTGRIAARANGCSAEPAA